MGADASERHPEVHSSFIVAWWSVRLEARDRQHVKVAGFGEMFEMSWRRGRRACRRTGAAVVMAVVAGLLPAGPEPAIAATPPASVDVALIESPAPERAEPSIPEGRFGSSDGTADRTRVRELVDGRSATSDVWEHSDGTLSVRNFVVPRYFQPEGSSEWQRIDTKLVPDEGRDGRVRSKANRWSVSFGPSDAAEGMLVFDLEGHAVSFRPLDAVRSVAPVADDSTVTYEGLWPATDAVYEVSATGTDERLVLQSADAPNRFEFGLSGATPRRRDDGGIDLVVGETVVGSIPPLTVETTKGPLRPEAAGAEFEVVPDRRGGGGRVTIALDREWLAGLPGGVSGGDRPDGHDVDVGDVGCQFPVERCGCERDR